SITTISMRGIAGSCRPRRRRAIAASSRLDGTDSPKMSLRKPGFASSTIRLLRWHSRRRYGPVPTGWAPKPAPQASTVSRARLALERWVGREKNPPSDPAEVGSALIRNLRQPLQRERRELDRARKIFVFQHRLRDLLDHGFGGSVPAEHGIEARLGDGERGM